MVQVKLIENSTLSTSSFSQQPLLKTLIMELRLKKVFSDYKHVLNITQIRSTDKFLFFE